MRETMTAIEQEILKNVVRAEFDFITYVDVVTGGYRSIIIKEGTHVAPPETGDYAAVNAETIPVYVHPEDQAACAAQMELSHIKQELEKQERFVVAYRLLCGEEYRRKEISIYYHDNNKNTIVMTRRDVTEIYKEEQKKKEQLYCALMDAQHANQEKNEFLERMSHEIRTPMNSIIGLTYLTRENVDNQKQVLENLEKINRSAHFLLTFINDILSLSQIESGNVASIQEDTDFEDFLEKLQRKIEKTAAERRQQFSMEKRGRFQKKYRMDGERLKHALMNILENAVKFTQAEGRVDFIIETVADSDTDTTIRFEIRDTGIGMDEAFLPFAFEPFEQEGDFGTTINGGTGLGLAIAKNIIELMDGRIDVYSEKGKGSTFVATVRLEKVEDEAAGIRQKGRSEQLDYDFTGKRVLLVEDNDINIEITRNILTHKNFTVEVATDGARGVENFLQHDAGYYDAVLMDIRMPVMDGLEATKKIRSAGRADSMKIPIIAMTANVFEEDVRKSLEAGMDAYLSKPVDIRQMYQVLDGMIYR